MDVLSVVFCCVLSGRGLCDGLITRPEESYRLWCVVVCELETSWIRRPCPIARMSHQKEEFVRKCVLYYCHRVSIQLKLIYLYLYLFVKKLCEFRDPFWWSFGIDLHEVPADELLFRTDRYSWCHTCLTGAHKILPSFIHTLLPPVGTKFGTAAVRTKSFTCRAFSQHGRSTQHTFIHTYSQDSKYISVRTSHTFCPTWGGGGGAVR